MLDSHASFVNASSLESLKIGSLSIKSLELSDIALDLVAILLAHVLRHSLHVAGSSHLLFELLLQVGELLVTFGDTSQLELDIDQSNDLDVNSDLVTHET